VHIRSWGDKQAPLLVMLHGWGDVSASWQFAVDALAREWRVLALDWRGFGLSAWDNESYWFPDYLADLDFLLEHVSPDQPVRLVAHSLGGNVASLYAGVRPERVAGLVNLEGIGLPRRDSNEAPSRYAKWLLELRETPSFRSYPNHEAFAERLRKQNSLLSVAKASYLAQHMSEDDGAGGVRPAVDPFHRLINPTLYRVDEMMACWRNVTAPVLFVAGADSVLFKEFFPAGPASAADYRERLACFANLREIVLPNCGHNMHHDQPEELARLLEEFFTP